MDEAASPRQAQGLDCLPDDRRDRNPFPDSDRAVGALGISLPARLLGGATGPALPTP